MTTVVLPQRVRISDEPIRFYFDESCLGLGQTVATAREDAIFPGHPRSPIDAGVGVLDSDWIAVVAKAGWVVLQRDRKVRWRPAEREALVSHPLRVVVLTSAGDLKVWDQLGIVVRRWDDIEAASSNPAPWLCHLTKTGLYRRDYPT